MARGGRLLPVMAPQVSRGRFVDIESATEAIRKLRSNLDRVVKGHESSVDLLVVAILARGHVLLESVPGEGKTLLASALAASIDGMTAGRVSGQPTLKPSDLVGAEIASGDCRSFESGVRSSTTSCSSMNSTALTRVRNPHCSRPCRNSRSR